MGKGVQKLTQGCIRWAITRERVRVNFGWARFERDRSGAAEVRRKIFALHMAGTLSIRMLSYCTVLACLIPGMLRRSGSAAQNAVRRSDLPSNLSPAPLLKEREASPFL